MQSFHSVALHFKLNDSATIWFTELIKSLGQPNNIQPYVISPALVETALVATSQNNKINSPRTFQPAGAKLSNAPHFLCSKRQNRWYLFNINESTDLVKNQLYFTLDC